MTEAIRVGTLSRVRAATSTPMVAGRIAKRALDIAGSAFGLALIALPAAVVALLIRADSPGPVLFRQKRIGRDGRPFTIYKFRTMQTGNSSDAHREYVTKMIRHDDGSLRNRDGAHKLEDDPRITGIGRVLRKTSLDELPQLLNVFKGDMSLVGPRPPLDYEVDAYTPRHLRRLGAVPGITGLWQVSGRNKTTFEEMVDLDLAYIENWSFLLDLKILAKTVPEVLGGKGA